MCKIKRIMYVVCTSLPRIYTWMYIVMALSVVLSGRDKCAPGSYYQSGKKKCLKCPLNTYRDSSDKNEDSCKPCASGHITYRKGSTSQSDCMDPTANLTTKANVTVPSYTTNDLLQDDTDSSTIIIFIVLIVLVVLIGAGVTAYLLYRRYKHKDDYSVSIRPTNTRSNQMPDQCEIIGGTPCASGIFTPDLEENVYCEINIDEYGHCVDVKSVQQNDKPDSENDCSDCQTITPVTEDKYDQCQLNAGESKRATDNSVTENIYNRTIAK